MKTSSPRLLTLLTRAGVFAPVLALLTLFAQNGGAAPIITSIVETGGDNEATDTITAKWTGQTFPVSVANEPFTGAVIGNPYTVGTFGNWSPTFVDRNHRYTNAEPPTIPSYLLGQEYIMSGNDNRENPAYTLDVTVSAAPDGRTVNVTVLDNDADVHGEKAPVAGARVEVVAPHARVIAEAKTDGYGVAGLPLPVDIDPMDLVVTVHHDSFNTRHLWLNGENVVEDPRKRLYGRGPAA